MDPFYLSLTYPHSIAGTHQHSWWFMGLIKSGDSALFHVPFLLQGFQPRSDSIQGKTDLLGCREQLRCRKLGIKLRPKGGKIEYLNKAVLQKLYVTEGKPVSEISRILSCSRSVVNARCKEYGIVLSGNRKTAALDRKLLYELYIDKKSTTRDIANIIGCSREAVRIRCKKLGIPLRQPGRTI